MPETSLVTIGIPVYNGADYIAETLESVIKQTHENLEVLVCDNCSTDETPDIVRQYAKLDHRIVLLENETNLGAADNFNLALREANADFFAWLSADDTIAPTYIEKALDLLQARPELVAAFSHATKIDHKGVNIGNYRAAMDKLRLDDPSASVRFNDSVLGFPAIVLFGLMRRSVMLDTPGHGAYIGGDRVFVSEVALKGRIARIDEELFFRRVHEGAYSALLDKKAKSSWFTGTDETDQSGIRNRIRKHLEALERSAPDPQTLRSGKVTLLVRFPLVLFRSQSFTMLQKMLRVVGWRIDPARFAS